MRVMALFPTSFFCKCLHAGEDGPLLGKSVGGVYNALILIADVLYCDDITVTFSDIIIFSDVNPKDGIRDILYNQCTSNT